MIRRRAEDGFLLIRQTDHAQLAAKLAGMIGNSRFAPPMRRAAVLAAVQAHDDGWAAHDELPAINPRGQPMDVFETPPVQAMAIWSLSTNKAAAVDPYAGLLVSLHGLALSLHIRPEKSSPRNEMFSLIKFQHAQIERQEELRRQLGMASDLPLKNGLAERGTGPEEDLLRRNFSLLQLADAISLNLCFDECRFPSLDFSAGGGDAGDMKLRMSHSRPGHFSLDPWPFDRAAIDLSVAAKRIPARQYAYEEDLRRAWAAAENSMLPLNLSNRSK